VSQVPLTEATLRASCGCADCGRCSDDDEWGMNCDEYLAGLAWMAHTRKRDEVRAVSLARGALIGELTRERDEAREQLRLNNVYAVQETARADTLLARLNAAYTQLDKAEAEVTRLRDQREQDARCTACRGHSNFNTLPDDEDCAECKAVRAALPAPKEPAPTLVLTASGWQPVKP